MRASWTQRWRTWSRARLRASTRWPAAASRTGKTSGRSANRCGEEEHVSFRRYCVDLGQKGHPIMPSSTDSARVFVAFVVTSAFLSLQVLLELSGVVKSISLEQQ